MLAVDVSNYTGELTPQSLQAWRDAGVGLVIAQAIDPPAGYPVGRTREQVLASVAAGLAVDAYVWLWFDLDAEDIRRKLSLLTGLSIRQLWLDVEDTAAIKYDQATCESKVQVALDVCDAWHRTYGDGVTTGVYTGRWFWADARYMGNTTRFADRELWDANYDNNPDAAQGFVAYGGWAGARIKQYRGTSTLAGIGNVDLNVLSVAEEGEIDATGGSAHPEPDEGCADYINALGYIKGDVMAPLRTYKLAKIKTALAEVDRVASQYGIS